MSAARKRATERSIAIVGRGRLGSGLHRALGARCVLVPARAPSGPALAAASIWLLAVPDPRIAALAARLAPARRGRAGRTVLHASASLPLSALGSLQAAGAQVGVIHPLVSFASTSRPPALAGAAFVLGGDRAAVAAGRSIARAVGARPVVRAIHGPRYHALAALVANGSAALAGVAQRELERLGLTEAEARRGIGALLRSVAENVGALGMPAALTGPIARGDTAAVRAQREALEGTLAGELYVTLARAMLAEARTAGLDRTRGHAIARELEPRGPARGPPR